MEQSIHINYTKRKFLCLENFSTEGRYCFKDKTYTAYPVSGGYKLVFEYGDMNFTNELFERVIDEWSDVLMEITG